MATIIQAPPVLSGDLTLFHTTDPLLGNSPVLVFHGPASTIGATSSRMQVHVFTPAGLGSYARLSVAPTSPYYSAVTNLPREEQGDEICRGLAFGLKKYFTELPDAVRTIWCSRTKGASAAALFGDHHVAILATRMTRIENVDEVIKDISQGFGTQRLSWSNVDVVLPPGSIQEAAERPSTTESDEIDESQIAAQKFGRYADLVAALGPITFLPTSKLKRAPSKASSVGRSASFLRSQKETIRNEIHELVYTEESYVARLNDVQEIAKSLRNTARPEDEAQLDRIFPPSLRQIQLLNDAFSQELSAVAEGIEAAASHDIENTSETHATADQARQDFVNDSQGVGSIAKCLQEWFPKLSEAYQDYLKLHAESSQLLRTILRSSSPLAASLQGIGEQKLTSLLIEPVQRLPRYNLYIDVIAKQLPVRHPAIRPLLKARDIITNICAESQGTGLDAMVERLSGRTAHWPGDLQICGRLVNAVDCEVMIPPYSSSSSRTTSKILLLFVDMLVLVEKSTDSTTSSRTLLAELESGSSVANKVASAPAEFSFIRAISLHEVQCTECHDGQALQLLTFCEASKPSDGPQVLDSCQVLLLGGSYEGKASRLVEDICKAELESRFSEAERESCKWEFRATDAVPDNLGLFSAVYENSNTGDIHSRKGSAAIRVLVDIDRHADRPRAGQHGLRTVIALSPTRDGLWRITVDALDGTFNREHLSTDEIVPSIRRKLAALLTSRLTIDQAEVTACMLDCNEDILRSIELQAEILDEPRERVQPATRERARSRSPRKLISNFLNNVGPLTDAPSLTKREMPVLSAPSQIPRVAAPVPAKPPSRESRPASRDLPTPKTTPSNRTVSSTPSSTSEKLESTLSAYILALKARKGNIVGRNLKMRAGADELSINELYNGLLEDSSKVVLAAQAAVDVLFAAFEKFVNVAWKEHFGAVVPASVMQEIQLKAESLFPADFDKYVRSTIAELPPQNKRAFKSIMNLLADLLDGTGNDGDRGILTVAFAEVLVTESDPLSYIALIDRFVDDTDTYFGEPIGDLQKQIESDSLEVPKGGRSTNSVSMGSTQSSLRKKFGFGVLSRENSKSEAESKVSSVWRTLSKSGRSDASPGNSISKGSHARHMSVDADHSFTFSRPASQDGAKGGFSEGNSTHSPGLTTIGEHPSFIPTGASRKKRRSSLSDLKPLESSPSPKREVLSPTLGAQYLSPGQRSGDDRSFPNSPLASTPSSKSGSARFNTPSRVPRPQLPSSFMREASPASISSPGSVVVRPKSSGGKMDEVVITSRPGQGLMLRPASPVKALSPAPSQRTGLAERPGAGNIIKRPSPQPEKVAAEERIPEPSSAETSGSPKKLRMQSPQKLRERLQSEQTSMAAAHLALQEELQSISDQLAATPSRMGSIRSSKPMSIASRGPPTYKPSTTPSAENHDLLQRVRHLETDTLPKSIATLEQRLASLQVDVTASLTVSERKSRQLDELYREANGENEALYARFNDELSRILKAVRGGEGVDELKRQLEKSEAQAASLRRENGRLKREVAGLRAQLRE